MLGSVFGKVKDDTKLHMTVTLSLPPCSLGFLCESFVNVIIFGNRAGPYETLYVLRHEIGRSLHCQNGTFIV